MEHNKLYQLEVWGKKFMKTMELNSVNTLNVSNTKKNIVSKVISFLSLDYGLHFIIGDTTKLS